MSDSQPNPVLSLQLAATEIQRIKPNPTTQLALFLVQSIQHHFEMADTAVKLKEVRDYAKLFGLYVLRYKHYRKEANAIRATGLRSERRLGKMLSETPRSKNGHDVPVTQVTAYQAQLDELGIKRKTAIEWQHLAEIENAEFEDWLTEEQQKGIDLTTSAALEYWRKHYGPPPLIHEPVDGIPDGAPEPPDDDEVNGEYEHANFGLNLQIAIQEFDQAFTEIMSLTAETAILELCQEQREKIAMLQAEMR